MIPENTLKFPVGVLLCAFGTFWVGEGIGLQWPDEDWSLPVLNIGFLAAALIAVLLRRPDARRAHWGGGNDLAQAVWIELFGLFVDDGSFALSILAWLAVAWLILPWFGLPPALPPAILFTGRSQS